MLGQDQCGTHGGRARQVKAAGRRRDAERKATAMAVKWGVPIEISATDAIIGQVHLWTGLAVFYAERVEALSDEEKVWGRTSEKIGGQDYGITKEAKPNIWIVLHERASQNAVKFASEAIRAGIEERRVRLAEQQGALVADAIGRIAETILEALKAAGLTENLARVFNDAFIEAAPRHLRLLTA
jgi:hypothetical protein